MQNKKIFKELWYKVFRGGESFIYDLEVLALCEMLHSLNGADKEKFHRQLVKLDFVQRSPDGKIVALYQGSDTYFKTWGNLLFENKDNNLLAFQIKLAGEGCPKNKLALSIYFHQGRISSIEYISEIKWPDRQKKIRLDSIDWLCCDGSDVNVLSSELLI